jgi:hypothetical protein
VPLLVISQLQPQVHQRLLVVHETMHWLERCSGKGIDFEHADQLVWEEARADAQETVVAQLETRRGRHRVMWSQAGEDRARPRTKTRPARVSTRQ